VRSRNQRGHEAQRKGTKAIWSHASNTEDGREPCGAAGAGNSRFARHVGLTPGVGTAGVGIRGRGALDYGARGASLFFGKRGERRPFYPQIQVRADVLRGTQVFGNLICREGSGAKNPS